MSLIFVFFIYLLFTLLVYGKLPLAFFQQDEWAIFGNYIFWDKANLDIIQRLFIYQQYTHLIPLSNLFSYLQFKVFGLNFFPYAVVNILLHLVNAFLVYYLTLTILRRRSISFLAGLFFLTNSISHQAVTWMATTTGTVGSTLFLSLSLIFFAKRYLIISFLLLFISLGFKETSLFVLFFYPVFWVMNQKGTLRNIGRILITVGLLGIGYILVRVVFIISGQPVFSSSKELSQPDIFIYALRLFINPIKVLAQSIIPQNTILSGGELIVKLGYPQFVLDKTPNPYIVESVGADIVSFVSFLLILAVCFLVISYFQRVKEAQLRKGVIMSIIFILLSAVPLIIIPGKAGYFSLTDGRHLYATSIFSSILLAIVTYAIYQWFSPKKLVLPLVFFVVVSFLFFHITKIRGDINQQIGTGFIRKSILDRISKAYPKLPAKVIFYIESDKAYYGLAPEDKILPFQSGVGQTLLVWYNERGELFPACFFQDQYLYVQVSEGYKECGGRGFGYFRKMESLKSVIFEQNIGTVDIIGFKYISSTNTLGEITDSLRRMIAQ